MMILINGLIIALCLFGVGANPSAFFGSEFRRAEGKIREQ